MLMTSSLPPPPPLPSEGGIILTPQQKARLKVLEDDPIAKVIGFLGAEPVVRYSGRNKKSPTICAVGKLGRMRRLGNEQLQVATITNLNDWTNELYKIW
jgi:hypothetical protein